MWSICTECTSNATTIRQSSGIASHLLNNNNNNKLTFQKRTVNANRHTGAVTTRRPSLQTEQKSLEWTFETVQRHRWMIQLRWQSVRNIRSGCGDRSGPKCNCLHSGHLKLVVVSRLELGIYTYMPHVMSEVMLRTCEELLAVVTARWCMYLRDSGSSGPVWALGAVDRPDLFSGQMA